MNLSSFKKAAFMAAVLFCSFFYKANAQNSDTLSQYILTPKAGPEPKINGPKVFGVRPGHPVIFTIPASGTRPMTFSADNLPNGICC